MQVVALALLKRAMPFLFVAVSALGVGLYLGYQIEARGLAVEKLALSVQQADDAKAVAAANAAAAAELMKANAAASAAEATMAAASDQANRESANLAGQIAAQAVQPGQDAQDAPVLANTLDALKGLP